MGQSRPPAALLALAVMGGCSSSSEVVLTVKGEAPGAVTLLVRLIDANGASKDVRTAGDADHPVQLPATIYLQLAHTDRIGVAVWVADGGGAIVARAMTDTCVPATSGRYDLTLSPAPDGWTPATIDACRCDGDSLTCGLVAPDAGAPVDEAPPDDLVAEDSSIDLSPIIVDAPEADLAADAVADVAPAPDGPAMRDVGKDTLAHDAAVDAPRRDAAVDAAAPKRDAAADRPADAQPTTTPVAVPNALFGFELAAPDWTSIDTTLSRDTTKHTQGAASLSFTIPATGASSVKSRAFVTDDLALGDNTSMSIDIFVAAKQTGDANTEMWVDCQSAGVFGIYMGYRSLTPLKVGGWTPVTFALPAGVASAFAGKFSDCSISFHVVGTGLFRYDRMGFVP